MLNPEELVVELGECANICSTSVEDIPSEIREGNVLVIGSGSILALNSRRLDSGTLSTQTFGRGDPLGFAEILARQPLTIAFKEIEPTTLLRIDGELVKQAVNKSGILAKEIIRYSLARTFDRARNRVNIILEDWLFDKYKKDIVRLAFDTGAVIFSSKSTPEAMFFIEKGQVCLLTENKKKLVTLRETDCFGEASLISTRRRSLSAVAETDCVLLKINEHIVEKEIRAEHPLVKLTVIQLLRRVHLMNQMRLVESGDTVYSG
jgi:CRP-like cAMP-binding protein